jgi:hypothetical protein
LILELSQHLGQTVDDTCKQPLQMMVGDSTAEHLGHMPGAVQRLPQADQVGACGG